MAGTRIFDFDRAIVRTPGRSVVDGLRAAGGDGPDPDAILAEHAAYVGALGAAGLTVDVLPPLEAFPDAMFVEDPALVFAEDAILLRPGAPTRQAEAEAIAPALRERFDRVLAIGEGTADGGDVLVTRQSVYIGLSDRTDRIGAAALARQLAGIGRTAMIVETPKDTLHLKSACSLIDEETLLVTPSLAAAGIFDGFRLLIVDADELGGANGLRVNDVMLAGRSYPRTIDLLAGHGLDVVPLAVTEIGKIDAGLTCMSLRWATSG